MNRRNLFPAIIATLAALLKGFKATAASTVSSTLWQYDGTTISPIPSGARLAGPSAIVTVTTTYLALVTDRTILADTSSAGFTVSLEAAPLTGQMHSLKNLATNLLTISGNGKLIDGNASISLPVQNNSLTIQYDGTAWRIL